MAAMHVGRQSLYDTFGDKRELYLRALDVYRESTQQAMRRLFASGRPLRECFGALLFGIVRESRADHERGCLLLAANLERDLGDKDIARLVTTNQAEVEALFEEALRNAQRAGELAATKDPCRARPLFHGDHSGNACHGTRPLGPRRSPAGRESRAVDAELISHSEYTMSTVVRSAGPVLVRALLALSLSAGALPFSRRTSVPASR